MEFQREHPRVLTLAALVDPALDLATATAAAFGFAFTCGSIDELLARGRPDACLVTTPVALNARLTLQLVGAGVPVLMEKPPGASIAEARQLVADLARLDARVMVSMNRRFEPGLRAALDWIGTAPIRRIEALMARVARTEPGFVEHTGLHVIDLVRSLGGKVATCEARWLSGGGSWYQARLGFASGATGLIDLMPTAGVKAEFLKLHGDDFRVEIRAADYDRGGWRAWRHGRLEQDETPPAATPPFRANGTLAETEAFVRALQNDGPFWPSPADVLPAMEICRQLQEARPAESLSS